MKIKTLTSCFFLAFAISSCIQDEALNSEAAIDGCTGADVQLANINANEKTVDVYVNKGADLTKQELKFTIPEGAIIRPNQPLSGDIGIIYDFSVGYFVKLETKGSCLKGTLLALLMLCLHQNYL